MKCNFKRKKQKLYNELCKYKVTYVIVCKKMLNLCFPFFFYSLIISTLYLKPHISEIPINTNKIISLSDFIAHQCDRLINTFELLNYPIHIFFILHINFITCILNIDRYLHSYVYLVGKIDHILKNS